MMTRISWKIRQVVSHNDKLIVLDAEGNLYELTTKDAGETWKAEEIKIKGYTNEE
jgi:hypothetical protein